MLHGPQEENLKYIRAVPELEETLPESTADELAADHYQVLGFEIHPFESAFLEPDGLIGGTVIENVLSTYLGAGFAPPSDSGAADHIGCELHFLAELCERQTGQSCEAQVAEVAQLHLIQYRFLEEHLLPWLPVLVETIRRQRNPFYTALSELTLALSITHFNTLAQYSVAARLSVRLPAPPDLLADESAGLRDIAAYLLTPVFTGVYFSPLDIRRLARQLRLPRGFGDRRHMFTSLLRNAAEYDQMPVLAGALRLHFEDAVWAYQALESSPVMHDSLEPFTRPWREQAQHTIVLLAEIERLARENALDQP